MCTNYKPSSREIFTQKFEDIRDTKIIFKPEVFPNDFAPIYRMKRSDDAAVGTIERLPARFGLVPSWAKDDQVTKFGRMANNARTETVSEKPMFRYAWHHAHFCLVPVDMFYEPNWETGSAIRWGIEMADHEPFAIGGLWESHGHGDTQFHSFTMLTVNADAHPLMNHFHRPGDEKRMPIIVPAKQYQHWLEATPETATTFFKQYPAGLMAAQPEPKPQRKKMEKPKAKMAVDVPEGIPVSGELF